MPEAKPTPRCAWAANASPLMQAYHDTEWGVPVHDDAILFEFITLEGAQAGLSWETVLNKRARYRAVFANFDRARVARFTPKQIDAILTDPGVIRHRGKIESVVSNARAIAAIAAECGSFDAYLWSFVGGKPLRLERGAAVPVSTPLAAALSRDLKRRGLRFVGPTIVYAFMQAVGIANDHTATCAFRSQESRAGSTKGRDGGSLGSSFHRHRHVALPFLFTPAEQWDTARATRLARAGLSTATPIDPPEVNAAKEVRIKAAFGVLREQLEAAEPDVLLIFGDDQLEQFNFKNFRRSRSSPGRNIQATRSRAGSACRSATNAPT